ncbi:MAG: hypothetical protein MI920_00370 [Kiloniellales bacterium]|nr:hypothetical protein [Kiloniellales bacterium]
MFGGGGQSGYRYRLQNNAVGLVILFGSRYLDQKKIGANLKIDCSPAFLMHREPEEVQMYLTAIADAILLNGWNPSGCAVHVCADFQGWSPPADFERHVTARASLANTFNGLTELRLRADEGAAVYGERETFDWGSRSSIQFQVYNKTITNRKFDKVDYWDAIWSHAHDEDGVVLYDDKEPVWRIEYRFHHSVLLQIGDGYGSPMLTYLEVAEILNDLWRYGLANYRLDHSERFVDPVWQWLYEDLEIVPGAKRWMAKRVYKRHGSNEQRNVCLAIGNALSVYARRDLQTPQVVPRLKKAGLWALYCRYCRERGLDPQAEIAQGLARRRLVGMAA